MKPASPMRNTASILLSHLTSNTVIVSSAQKNNNAKVKLPNDFQGNFMVVVLLTSSIPQQQMAYLTLPSVTPKPQLNLPFFR